ncbi:MAG: amidohydrolase family protein [Actinomycetota bacterium]|nr:amidohydrolase family protein [Actinomycetota bacterium]
MGAPGTQEWFDQVIEDVVEPERPIVDPHHHLWPDGGALPYGLDQLHADTADGHRIERTVFIECHAAYDVDAPEHLAPLGETRFVTGESARDPDHLIGGIVASADLRRDDLDDILDAHVEIAGGLFKGIRHAIASAEHPETLTIPGRAPRDLAADADFRRGVARLGERGLTYDSWHYHHQQREFLELARAVPGTTMVLDHFGTPLGVGPYAGRRDEILATWKDDLAAIAACPNVVAKLGGMAMPDNGFGWHTAERPATSDELVAAQRDWYLHTIDRFGPERCMFESNFPVDRFSLSYRTFWNAAKKIAADFDDAERDALFRTTAGRVYRLE